MTIVFHSGMAVVSQQTGHTKEQTKTDSQILKGMGTMKGDVKKK